MAHFIVKVELFYKSKIILLILRLKVGCNVKKILSILIFSNFTFAILIKSPIKTD
jgi:hypothetical protein